MASDRSPREPLPPFDPRLREGTYPFQDLLGFEVTGWAKDWARLEVPLLGKHMNRYGIPHGGLYASLIDTVMGFAGCYTGDPEQPRFCMTLSLTTEFLSRATGEHLIAEGRRTGGGKSVFFAEATVWDENGVHIISGSGVFRYRRGA